MLALPPHTHCQGLSRSGIVEGITTTVHTFFTPAGRLWYDGHAATQSTVPASSRAAKAMGKIIPEPHGKLAGLALASPLMCLSGSDCHLEKALKHSGIQKW